MAGFGMTAVPKSKRRGWQRALLMMENTSMDRHSQSSMPQRNGTSPLSSHLSPPSAQQRSATDRLVLVSNATARPTSLRLSALTNTLDTASYRADNHPTRDIQPFLGPKLKKALAKQGMAMQRLNLEADEWDTVEVRSMLGTCYASKEVRISPMDDCPLHSHSASRGSGRRVLWFAWNQSRHASCFSRLAPTHVGKLFAQDYSSRLSGFSVP